MMPKGLFFQINIVIVAVAIVVTYIQPQFTTISETQDLIAVYQAEREKVSDVNLQLAALVSEMDEVSSGDRMRLVSYLPNTVDSISVQRDLKNITELSEAEFVAVEAADSSAGSARDRDRDEDSSVANTFPHGFSLSVSGTYEQIKDLLRLLERNKYPLEIHAFSLSLLEGGLMEAQLDIITYSYENPDPDTSEVSDSIL